MAEASSSVAHIKRSRKEATLYKIISDLFMRIKLENEKLGNLTLTRVALSSNKSVCDVFFYTSDGFEAYKERLKILTLYKPSMRKAVADSTRSRYVPDLRFSYDSQHEKQQQVEQLLNEVGDELRGQD